MSPTDAYRRDEELWSRYVAGDALSLDEQAQVLVALEDPERQRAWLADLEIHRALAHASWDAAPAERPRPAALRSPAWIPAAAAALLAFAAGWMLRPSAPTPIDVTASASDATASPSAPLDPVGPALEVPTVLIEPPTFANLELPTAGPPQRIGAERIELSAGRARLRFDEGHVLQLQGPATLEIESALSARLTSGSLHLRVPAKLAGFLLETPTARILDSGNAFEVEVTPNGDTQVHVTEGDLRLEPGRPGDWSGRDLRLVHNERARVRHLIDEHEGGPLVAEAQGPLGAFSALIVAGGRYVEVGHEPLLNKVEGYFTQLADERPGALRTEWMSLAFQGNGPSVHLTSGAKVELASLDDVLGASSLVAAGHLASDPLTAASFLLPVDPMDTAGILSIGGQHYQFHDYATLQSLLEALRSTYTRRFSL